MQSTLLENHDRARNVRIIMWLFLGLFLAELLVIINEISILNGNDSFLDAPYETEMHDIARAILAIGHFALLIMGAVFFVRWMARAFENYERAGGVSLFTKSAVQWAFFIPFINLFRPYKVVNEFWQGMQDQIFKETGKLPDYSNWLIGTWWALWIINNILSNISIRMTDTTSIDRLILSDYFELASGVVEVGAALLVIQFVGKYTLFEEEMSQLMMIQQLDGADEEENARV
ncbi:MAG: DUF4328 domain-containing protein [Bacteroidota bacterium]